MPGQFSGEKMVSIQHVVPEQLSAAAAAAPESLQLCPTLCDPIDGSPPGSAVPGILQATTLEWVAISFSNAWKWKVKVKSLSRVRLLVTPWTAAYQAPPSVGFSREEYWSGVPSPSPNNWIPYVKNEFWPLTHTTIYKNHQNIFKGLNISAKTIKLLE